ncbi:sodium-and chloride-dependent transporter [Helicobacter enhydrae]|uniref:Transporter n=1 Tax=Helicobacter enhydrae TaxID=222136 RepID=A0A1B1U6L8_9HELI|nr:sodium-dependent transporter [Helicobacter enhydrae]ANV98409.1 sodium-and chloride-dependent transporter [Helicobacter enhydrae]
MNNFSKIGFILATLGSSIGLGHIWRFPYMAGTNGGGAFIVFYLFLAIVIGVSMLIAEMLIGNKAKSNPVESFAKLEPNHKSTWKFIGIMAIGGPMVMTFYAVVLGWVLYYLFVGSFNLPQNLQEAQTTFETLATGSIPTQIAGLLACMFLTAYIVAKGAKDGIEKLNLILMPLLFIIFIGLFFYAMSFDSFGKAVDFMFKFDIEKITPQVAVDVLGQVFFALSLGLGTILIYGAYANDNENLFSSSVWVVISGIFVSLVAGLIIFTLIFAFEGEPAAGPKLMFISLPLAFSQLENSVGFFANIIAFLFMLCVAFAGITSTVSIVEPAIAYLRDRFDWTQAKATWICCGIITIFGVMVILSITKDYSVLFSFGGTSLFDWMDLATSKVLMPFGGFFCLIFSAYVIGKERLRKYTESFFSPAMFELWYAIIAYIAPLVIAIIALAPILF